MSERALITANVTGLPGDDADGIHALMLGHQHDRALGEILVRRIATLDYYAVEIRYPLAGGTAEVYDAADRLLRIPRAVDALRIAGLSNT